MIWVSVSPFKTMYLKLPNICQSGVAGRALRSQNFLCNVFRETLASAALNYDPICFQQRLLLVDILAILHLTRSCMFAGALHHFRQDYRGNSN